MATVIVQGLWSKTARGVPAPGNRFLRDWQCEKRVQRKEGQNAMLLECIHRHLIDKGSGKTRGHHTGQTRTRCKA